MDRVRDLVAAGGVAVVLAQDADRLTRDPIHRAFLDEEMERFGTRLMALDDWGDDSHEGELLRYMKGWVSKGERLKTAERTRRGKLSKARQGKIVANHRPHYGFRYNATKDNYVVDEDEMRVVRRIFYMVGVEGRSLRAVRRTLEAERLSTPGGAKYWSQMFVRSVILDDVYLPHTYGEMKELVAPEVAARLDPRPALRHLLAQHQVQHLQTGEGKRVGWENLPQEAEDRAEAQRRVDSRACAGLRDTEGVGRRGSGIHQR